MAAAGVAIYRRPSGKMGPGAGRPRKYYRRSSREISVSLPQWQYDLAARVLAQAITNEVLDEHGYEPRNEEEERLILSNCPFHSLATEYTALICGINHNLLGALINELPRSYRADLAPASLRCCVTLDEI